MSQEADPSNRVMASMTRTMDLVMGAKLGRLSDLPQTVSIEFSGEEAEAKGSARHVADVVREAGYDVELDYFGEVEPVPGLDKDRHEFHITVK